MTCNPRPATCDLQIRPSGFESANEIKRVTLKPQRGTHHLVARLHVINSDFHRILLDVRLFQVSPYLKSTPSRLHLFFIAAVVLPRREVKCIARRGIVHCF